MSEQKQVQKSKKASTPEESVREAKDVRNDELTEAAEAALDKIDDVLDELDELLGDEQEAAWALKGYIQQGGE